VKAADTCGARRRPKAPKAPRWSLLLVGLLVSAAAAAEPASAPPRAAIASAHPLATEAGFEILKAGGNAFDAAVAVSAALAVVEPYSSGLGGGGFWLLRRAADGREVMLDGRERAPLAARRDMYLDAAGAVIPRASVDGPLAAGIPGEPAALVHLAEHYGRLPLAKSLGPAIRLAHDGFTVDKVYRRLAEFRRKVLAASPAAAAQFLRHGDAPAEGTVLRQPDLARTLKRIAAKGREGFYGGETATALVQAVRAAGGIWSADDLSAYQVVERKPISGEYRGWRVVSASPPSSGGVLLVEMLNMLRGHDLEGLDAVDRTHLLVEVMRRAYRDRAQYLGDPDQVSIPLAQLLSPYYAAGLMRDFDPRHATRSQPLPGGNEGPDTTHFSILDREGNQVAATLSINYPFGSCFVAPGTGVLLNDEMDDFSARPGVPNLYGLVGGAANAIAPGKRMLSSMSPTFVESPDGVAILGTPGGSRIISMVMEAVLAVTEGGGPQDWVTRLRIHHQYLPDRIQYEPGALSPDTVAGLKAMGYRLEALARPYGNLQAVYWDRKHGSVSAASDPRGIGAARTGPDRRLQRSPRRPQEPGAVQ
jgi:gamma-glutamyltranspeptidase/glutathione hydrolase